MGKKHKNKNKSNSPQSQPQSQSSSQPSSPILIPTGEKSPFQSPLVLPAAAIATLSPILELSTPPSSPSTEFILSEQMKVKKEVNPNYINELRQWAQNLKTEVKVESKEEVKVESKEEVKVESKEEVKVESKEEVNTNENPKVETHRQSIIGPPPQEAGMFKRWWNKWFA